MLRSCAITSTQPQLQGLIWFQNRLANVKWPIENGYHFYLNQVPEGDKLPTPSTDLIQHQHGDWNDINFAIAQQASLTGCLVSALVLDRALPLGSS